MTDRYHSITVVLEKDVREDDARALIDAIKQMRCVLTVRGVVSNIESMMAEERARHEIGKQLIDIVYPKRTKE